MEEIVEIAMFVFVLIVIALMGYVSFQGFDLRKPASWLYGVFGFLCGLAMGVLLSGNLINAITLGVIFAILILVHGATRHWHKKKYENMARSLSSRYREGDHPSLFARLVRKLLDRYK